MPAVVSSTERSSGGGTSDAEGTLRWSRSSKNDRKRERISAAFTERESRYVSEGALTIDCLPADSTRAMDLEGLIAEARERRPQPMPARERKVAIGMAVAYLAAAAPGGAVVAPGGRPLHLGTVVALVLLTALTMRAQFEIGPGVASPAALAIVPMFFLAPLHLVPLLVPLAQVISRIPDYLTKRRHVDRWLWSLGDAFPILGPVLILGLFAPGPPSAENLGIYVAALAAEMLLGIGTVVIGDVLIHGVSSFQAMRVAGWA